MQKFCRLTAVFILLLVLLVSGVSCTGYDAQNAPEKDGGRQAAEQQQSVQVQTGTKDDRNQKGLQLLSATVIKVVDGDTVYVKMDGAKEEKVRLIGVDTPESTREIEPYGKKAASYTQKQLNERKVWLELDAEERDKYGRLLAYIWLEKPAGTGEEEVRAKMFNAGLLLDGCAQVMTVPPNIKYVDYFVQYQREARESNKGLWSLDEDKEKYYVASKNSNKFHRPGCEWGQKIKPDNLITFRSRDDAFDAGYEPCRSCNP